MCQLEVLLELHMNLLGLVQVQGELVECHSHLELALPLLLAHVHVNGHENAHHRHGPGQKPV